MLGEKQLLNRLRDSLEPAMSKLGLAFALTGLSANFWTGLGLAISIAAGAVYASGRIGFDWYIASLLGGILLLASGFFDIVDGSVARATKKTSKKGAFLDSSFDKIAESVVFIGVAAGHLASPVLCMVGLALSLLVSYTRARAESLGVELKGIGIGERAERLLILAVIGMIPVKGAMTWAIVIVSIVAGITLAHRIIVTSKRL